MSGLEERLKGLEQRMQKYDELLERQNLALHGRNGNAARYDSQPESLGPTRPVPSGDGISLQENGLQELPPEETLGDGMAITFVDEEDSAYFGQLLRSDAIQRN